MMETKRSHKNKNHLESPTPPLLSPDAPKDYGKGRECKCGKSVNRYSKLSKGQTELMCFSCRKKKADKALKDAQEQRKLLEAGTGRKGTTLHNLKPLRLDRRLTQQQLADQADCTMLYVSLLEKKTHGAGPQVAKVLARVLGVGLEELVG